jgi:succinyl-CoA synthetase alpha subunit
LSELFQKDPQTEGIVMVGEIGGSAEEDAAAFIAATSRKPVVAYIAGVTAPPASAWGMRVPSSAAAKAQPRVNLRHWKMLGSRR